VVYYLRTNVLYSDLEVRKATMQGVVITMDVMEKLRILTGAAKYDVACTSSGSDRRGVAGGMGSTIAAGCCHSFASDGRCISLLKVLMTNFCIYDCKYCINRSSNDVERAVFTPEEIADLTINFYKRNYIEGLFLSSAVIKNPDHTMELMIGAIAILRYKHNFWGYVHVKAIPGASPDLIEKMGLNKKSQPEYFSIKRADLKNINVWISRTGYTGEDGFEILVKNQFSQILWYEILESGEEFDIAPIGLGARDTLRLEAALHLYGNDLDEETTPPEAGLGWSVAKNKAEEYNGKEIIMGQIEDTVPKAKKLVGFEMIDNAIARQGYEIYYDDKQVGVVTSGGVSPTLGKNIGLGYIKLTKDSIFLNKTLGTNIQIMVRNKLYNAKIVKRPFIEKKYYQKGVENK